MPSNTAGMVASPSIQRHAPASASSAFTTHASSRIRFRFGEVPRVLGFRHP